MISNDIGVFLVVAGLILAAFASLAEAAVLSINELRFRRMIESGVRRAVAFNLLLTKPRQLLSSIVIVNTVAIVIMASVGVELVYTAWQPNIGLWAFALGVVLLLLVTLVFGEIVPKAIARQWPEQTAMLLLGPLSLLTAILGPAASGLEWITGLVLRPFGWRGDATPALISEEELEDIIAVGAERGILEADERQMIHGIIELEETAVTEVMVPRIDIVAADIAADPMEVVRLIVGRGYSRIPVYEGTIDTIVGVVYAKDVLRDLAEQRPLDLRRLARPVHLIPENHRVDELLHDLQRRRVHLAIVVDEYGGTAGLVTIEDLLEQIVGEIQDEYDHEEEPVKAAGEDVWLVVGGLNLDRLAEETGVAIESQDVDTVGGYLASRLGKIPSVGDRVAVETGEFVVEAMTGRRIRQIRVTRNRRSGGLFENNDSQSGQ